MQFSAPLTLNFFLQPSSSNNDDSAHVTEEAEVSIPPYLWTDLFAPLHANHIMGNRGGCSVFFFLKKNMFCLKKYTFKKKLFFQTLGGCGMQKNYLSTFLLKNWVYLRCYYMLHVWKHFSIFQLMFFELSVYFFYCLSLEKLFLFCFVR